MQAGSHSAEIEGLVSAEPDELDRRETVLIAEFMRHPGWAELLLPALASSSAARVANARRLLCMFPTEAVLTIAREFEVDNPTARFEILGILWRFVVTASPANASSCSRRSCLT